jgi:hypothetical protein
VRPNAPIAAAAAAPRRKLAVPEDDMGKHLQATVSGQARENSEVISAVFI